MAVFHLKYRPQKIAELDLPEVVESLRAILQKREIPQAYLFSGPKGSGKTSAARILARAVNCLKPRGVEPCGKCENCQEISRGSSVDVMEIDGASNRGIDDARVLKERAILMPAKLIKKVFIIDEVHMLTKEAFNALLKLIEEPPPKTVFILCTTDEGKIPATVVSRLVRIGFRKGKKKELLGSLQKIIKGEKVEVDEAGIDLIVRQSDGSFRNIHRLFNEIFISLGQKMTADKVGEFLALRRGEYSEEEMEKDLEEGKIREILAKLEDLAAKGIDFREMRQRLIVYWQDKLLKSLGVSGNKQAGLSSEQIRQWLKLLVAAGSQEREVEMEQLPLELAVIDFWESNRGQTTEANRAKKPEDREERKEEPDSRATVDRLEKEWNSVLKIIKPMNYSVEAFLRATRPKEIKGEELILEVFYPFHKDKLEEDKNRRVVEDGVREVLGMNLKVKCVLGVSKREPIVIKNTMLTEGTLPAGRQAVGEEKDVYEMAKEIFG